MSLALICAAALAAPAVVVARPGALDPAFGSGGRVTTQTGLEGNWRKTEVQSVRAPDGGVVLAAHQNLAAGSLRESLQVTIARYGRRGRLRQGFSGDGRVRIVDPGGLPFTPIGIAVDRDGRIVLAGTSFIGTATEAAEATGVVVRLLPDGSPDLGFGEGGIVRSHLGAPASAAVGILHPPKTPRVALTGVAVDDQDRIVLGGSFLDGLSACDRVTRPIHHSFVARLTAGGQPDTSFGRNGIWVDQALGEPGALSLDAAGDPLLVALQQDWGCPQGAVLTHLSDAGTPDPEFGAAGGAAVGARQPFRIATDPRGRILLLGRSRGIAGGRAVATLSRLRTNGSLDGSFGRGGWFSLALPGGSRVSSVAVQGDGRILVAATIKKGIHSRFALIRRRADGRADSSFGDRGRVITRFGNGDAVAGGMVVAGGRALVAGTFVRSGRSGLALARYRLGS